MQTKGTAIRALLVAIEETYGTDGLAQVKDALSAEHRALLSGLLLPTKLYPIEVAAALHEAVRVLFGLGTMTANRRIGIAAARKDFSGVYRVFVRFMEFENVLKRADSAFKQYNSQGTISWSELRADHAVGTVTDVRGWTEPMWHAFLGRFEAVLALCGARVATAKVVRFSDTELAFELYWLR